MNPLSVAEPHNPLSLTALPQASIKQQGQLHPSPRQETCHFCEKQLKRKQISLPRKYLAF